MRKRLLIAITMALLFLVNSWVFFAALKQWAVSREIAQAVAVVGPAHTEKTVEALNTIASLEEAKRFAGRMITSNAKNHESEHQLLVTVAKAHEKTFMVLAGVLGFAFTLACVLACSLYPLLKNRSNQRFKPTDPPSAGRGLT